MFRFIAAMPWSIIPAMAGAIAFGSKSAIHTARLPFSPSANTCIEATARYAVELGYHVTLVRDATAAFKPEMMQAAHELNGPTFAHAIVATNELIASLAQQG